MEWNKDIIQTLFQQKIDQYIYFLKDKYQTKKPFCLIFYVKISKFSIFAVL